MKKKTKKKKTKSTTVNVFRFNRKQRSTLVQTVYRTKICSQVHLHGSLTIHQFLLQILSEEKSCAGGRVVNEYSSLLSLLTAGRDKRRVYSQARGRPELAGIREEEY